MSSQGKPAPVCELSKIAIANASRARYEATLLDTTMSRNSTQTADHLATTRRAEYDKALEEDDPDTDFFYAPNVCKSLTRVVNAWTDAVDVYQQTASAAQDYANLLKALLSRNLRLKDHDLQDAQAWASFWLIKVDEAEKKARQARKNVQLWDNHLGSLADKLLYELY